MEKKQNYILVMCDDMGYGDTGFNGNKIIKTPFMDEMAAEGAVFENFYSGAPVCSPTRSTCLTGRHYYRTGVYCANEGMLPSQEITIQQLLKKDGYTTGHFGKWHLGTLSKTIPDGRRGGSERPELYSPPWERDFDVCFSSEVQMPLYNPYENQAFPSKYWTDEGVYATDNMQGDDSKVIMDRAVPFIQDAIKSDTPFFAVIWFHTPHAPVVAGEEYCAMYSEYPENMQHYFGCITAMDEQIGRLNNTLKELGVEDDTCVFFCSDNGPEGDGDTTSRNCGSTKGLRGRKRSLYNGGINVPAFVKWKKHVKPGQRFEFLASTLDYLPTILAECNVEMPDDRPIDGIDIKGHLQNAKTTRDKPIPLRYTNTKEGMFDSPTFGIICDDFKMLCNLNDNEKQDELYLTFADRLEQYDVKETNSSKLTEYKEYIATLAKSFEASHGGADYKQDGYKPVDDYISNSFTWK